MRQGAVRRSREYNAYGIMNQFMVDLGLRQDALAVVERSVA